MIELASRIVESTAREIKQMSSKVHLGQELGCYGASGDRMKFADSFCSELIMHSLEDHFRTHPDNKVVLIAEESGFQCLGNLEGEEGIIIILDPLDGSNNLRPWRTPCPTVAVSIAIADINSLAVRTNFDIVDAAAVMDVFGNQLYLAERGHGARAKGFGPLTSSPQTIVEQSIIGMDLDLQGSNFDSSFWHMENLLTHCKCQRRLGSSILDFAKVASGEYDSFVSTRGRMKLCDLAAVKLIVEEAGGVFEIVDGLGGNCHISEIIQTKDSSLLSKFRYRVIASGNPSLHGKIIEMLRQ